MTESFPTPGADEHPEVADISALGEGLLPPDRTAEVTDHLASCVLCADVQGSLEEIRAALGTLPGPVRMPEDIAGRIDAALAAEALLDSTPRTPGPGDGTPTAPSDATPHAAGSSASHAVSRETAPVREGRSGGASRRPPSRPGGSTGPGRAPRRRRLFLTAAAACAALVVGGLMVPMLMEDSGQQDAAQSNDSEGGINAADLDTEVRDLLAASPGDTSKEEPSAEGSRKPGGQPSLQDDEGEGDVSPKASPTAPFGAESAVAVPTCVTEAIDRTEAPLTVSRTTYEGVESYVVVLPHPGDQQQVDAYVVDAGCVGSGSGEPGKVVAQETVDRR